MSTPRRPYLHNCSPLASDAVATILEAPASEVRNGTEFRPLPRDLWRPTDPTTPAGCCGTVCCAPEIGPRAPAFWDVLATSRTANQITVWTVHYPELARAAS